MTSNDSNKVEFISVFEFCKKYKLKPQNVYRWIREGKFPKEKFSKITRTVERIVISSEFSPEELSTF